MSHEIIDIHTPPLHDGYRAPDGYFDHLPERTMNRIGATQQSKKPHHRHQWAWVATLVAIGICVFPWQREGSQNYINTEDYQSHLLLRNFDTYFLIQELASSSEVIAPSKTPLNAEEEVLVEEILNTDLNW